MTTKTKTAQQIATEMRAESKRLESEAKKLAATARVLHPVGRKPKA